MLKVVLETNQKFGRGYQLNIQTPIQSWVYDQEELSLTDAGGYVGVFLESYNKTFHTAHELHEVLRIAGEALRANKNDFMSRKLLKDIETGRGKYILPPQPTDYRTDEYGETWLSGRGTLVFAYTSWIGEGRKDDKGAKLLQGYCRLLAGKGYGGGASEIFGRLKAMDINTGVDWCKATYAKHVSSTEIMGLFNNL